LTPNNHRDRLIDLHGREAGIQEAILLLEALAAPMIERMAADPAGRANRERRPRIKAYQVAARRLRVRLRRVQQLAAAIEAPADVAEREAAIRKELGALGL
jgi:hypothetical protein